MNLLSLPNIGGALQDGGKYVYLAASKTSIFQEVILPIIIGIVVIAAIIGIGYYINERSKGNKL